MVSQFKLPLPRAIGKGRKLFSGALLAGGVIALFLLLNLLFPLESLRGNTITGDDLLLTKGVSPVEPLKPFRYCRRNYTNFLPCQDSAIAINFPKERNQFRERHCPKQNNRLRCLIPSPIGYKKPVSWPTSKEQIWKVNIPHTVIFENNLTKGWMSQKDDKWTFEGFGTMFPRGIKKYLERLEKYIPLNNGKIRTALDIGCGVGTFGAALFDYDILTMSIAPKDRNRGQIEFASERGIPALVSLLATQRLPFPSRAFDLVQCARCNVDFLENGGVYLLEVERLLRPNGYFVLGGPPVNWEGLEESWSELAALAQRMCWNVVAIDGNVAVWQKPKDHKCLLRRTRNRTPSFCTAYADPDHAWKRRLRPCISRMPNLKDIKAWPVRLLAPPIRFPVFPTFVKSGRANKSLEAGDPVSAVTEEGEQQEGDGERSSQITEMDEEAEDASDTDTVVEEGSGKTGTVTMKEGGSGEGSAADEVDASKDDGTVDEQVGSQADDPNSAERKEIEESEMEGARRGLLSAPEASEAFTTFEVSETKLKKSEKLSSKKKAYSRKAVKIKALGPVTAAEIISFTKDTNRWRKRIKHLRKVVLTKLGRGVFRNILDMNAGLGGFAANLVGYPVWVMNVVPITEPNTLPVIYDRGLLGVMHDWCEAFSAYPRTYDVIHATNFQRFIIAPKRCNILDVVIEMDRILRPGGKVIIRDSARSLVKVVKVAKAVRWQVDVVPSEDGPEGKELLIIASKPFLKQT